jgi:hypothetical protein
MLYSTSQLYKKREREMKAHLDAGPPLLERQKKNAYHFGKGP